jgi:ATP-dependent helicase HrpA
MPTLLEPGNVKYPKGHENEVPLEYIMSFFKARVRGLGGEIKKAQTMSDKIMILKAETGAGKSTIIPPELHLRFSELVQGQNKIIGCTQPTRLNTIEIPQDIVKLYPDLKLGENIGYQTGPISYKINRGVMYMTVETLVEQLKSMEEDDFMNRYSFIVIDEAHHRDLPTDVVMSMMKSLIKKNFQKENCPFLIIMSATLDVDHFAKYMETNTIIEISGKSYPIEYNFTKDDIELVVPKIVETVRYIHQNTPDDYNDPIRDILVFVPGMSEITSVSEGLSNEKDLLVIALYRENFIRGTTEFWNIFEPIEKLGVKRRVIVSTSIAETGVTIGTVKYVIDSGWSRVSEFYAPYGIPALVSRPVSQSSAIQRRGRSGRKGPGVWYPMFTQKTFEAMQTVSYPDIIRGEATPALLDIFIKDGIDLGKIDFLDMPSPDSILYSMEQLFTLGAVNLKEVTELGKIMATSRLKLNQIRTILSGYVFKVNVVDLITIISGLINKRLVIEDSKLYNENLGTKFLKQTPVTFKLSVLDKKYDKFRLAVADEFIEMLFLWEEFQNASESPLESKKWCDKLGLSYDGFMEWVNLRDEIILKLEEVGFKTNNNIPLLDCKSEDEFVETIRNIKRCIHEGFKLNTATWNETIQSYVSERHKFKIKSWSTLLTDAHPNYIIYDDVIMMYNSKSKIYSLTANNISVMDGWIAKEYDSRTVSVAAVNVKSNIKNMWAYKNMLAIKPIHESPVESNPEIEKSRESEVLKYSVVTGGYQKQTQNISTGKKIMVF